jgi:hypothetical protein
VERSLKEDLSGFSPSVEIGSKDFELKRIVSCVTFSATGKYERESQRFFFAQHFKKEYGVL